MEALLQEYYEGGMNDLSFIIINARDSLSELMIDELKRRVSFPVYQDNDKEMIWMRLQGGKDDMFLYDRCGRLTFYIPFPLSIIHPQQPIVSAAIHATYYEDLCGDSCMITEMESIIPSDYQESLDHRHSVGNTTNSTDILDVEDIKKVLNEENDVNINGSAIVVDDLGDEFSFLLNQNNSSAVDNKTDLIGNTTKHLNILNDIILFFKAINETIVMNITELPENETEFMDTINITSVKNTTDVTENTTAQISTSKKESFWDLAFNLFLSNKTTEEKPQAVALEKIETSAEPVVNVRCSDPSYEQMCVEWGKKKLWRIHLCCNSSHKVRQIHGHGHCGHFKAKKCKKLQPILKCCLGTVDAPTEPSLIDGGTTNQEYFATVG